MIKEKIIKAYENLADAYNAKIDYKPHNAFYDRPNTLKLIGDVKGLSVPDTFIGGVSVDFFVPGGSLLIAADGVCDFSGEKILRVGTEYTLGELFSPEVTHPKLRGGGSGNRIRHLR